MGDLAAPFDPLLLRLHRARAARRIGDEAFLAHRASEDIADRLEAVRKSFARTLILGGGVLERTLRARPALAARLGDIIVADPSEALGAVACDPERLPFADQAFDLALSPLLLHWCNDLPGALIQIRRALRPDGLFIATVFGGDTLHEARLAFIEAESALTGGASARIAPFGGVQDFAHLLQRAGFALPTADRDVVLARYREPLSLFDDLRAMGETGALRDRPRPLSRAVLAQAIAAYQSRFAEPDGRIRATFEMITMTGWAPAPSQPTPLKPGSAAMRLADALNVQERSAGEKAPR